ncbi:MAG: homoserine dehydrogenase [bacterium]|jgi:homoserine dehydrogenase|nr:homoserine dehydrogenase [bacterium]MDD3805151.1 homoserine dehydrogenase [bacterium]MDD4152528.1 homoserine dehydrogenase [bacterium]
MRSINIGILGLGTVGCGTAELLQRNAELISRRVGADIRIAAVVDLDLERPRPVSFPPESMTTDAHRVITDPDIDIIVEVIGGVHPAREFIIEALQQGKNVVTANKELIAKHGSEILDVAGRYGRDFLFEASVGGGIPIIGPLKSSLVANRIEKILGIVNGTTNYILTSMSSEGKDFADVLQEAQAMGYAEADPTSDVDGYDSAYKLAILSAIAFNTRIKIDDIYCEGISGISSKDIAYAAELGYVIKLLAVARPFNGQVEARVHPAMLPADHPLASVNDVFNAVWLRGDGVGDLMFYGRGAGSLPTGSAIIGDVVESARNIINGASGRISCTCFDKLDIRPISDISLKYYLRLQVADKPGVLASLAGVLGDHTVSISSVVQKSGGDMAELVIITHEVEEKNVQAAIGVLRKMNYVSEVSSLIRLEEE